MFVNGYFVGKILHVRSLPLCCGLATPGTESEAFQELSWDLVGRQGFEDTWGFVFCCWWWWSSWKNWLFRVAPGYFTYLHIILNVLCFLVIVILFELETCRTVSGFHSPTCWVWDRQDISETIHTPRGPRKYDDPISLVNGGLGICDHMFNWLRFPSL